MTTSGTEGEECPAEAPGEAAAGARVYRRYLESDGSGFVAASMSTSAGENLPVYLNCHLFDALAEITR